MDNLDIASYNFRGLQTEKKRRKVFNYLHEKKHDIVMIQETHSTKKNERVWRNEWGGSVVYSHYNSKARGVAILFRKGLDYQIHKKKVCSVGRYIILEIEINDLLFVLVNVYAPNEDSPKFFEMLFTHVNTFENPHKMYSGDFNIVRDPNLDREGVSDDLKPKSRAIIDKNMQNDELVDYWRQQNPDIKRFTWIRKNPIFLEVGWIIG